MRKLLTILAILICTIAKAGDTCRYVYVYPHGDSSTIDSNVGGAYVGGCFWLPSLATDDTTQVLSIDALGMFVLRHVTGGGGSGSPGGPNFGIQYNLNSNFSSSPLFTYKADTLRDNAASFFGGNLFLNSPNISFGSGAKIGFFGITPKAQQSGEVATAMATYGLVTSGTYAFSRFTGLPSTLAGYGIADAYTMAQTDAEIQDASDLAQNNLVDTSAAHLALIVAKQAQLNGTGLVRMAGTSVSYDNVTYYPFSNPSSFIPLTALSSTATGLSYNNVTGIFSLTSGYAIPTNAQIANWNTAYSNVISSLTTTGSSGAATLSAGVLNIPTPTLAGLGGISLSALSATAPLSYNSGTGAFSIASATTSVDGYLSHTDWNTFNNKQAALSLTTTGSSGAATLVGATLNVPQYTLAGLGGISLASLSASGPLSYNNTTGAFSIALATGSVNGYLSSTDWTTFNNKGSGSVTTFSSGNLSPLFTANVATATTTPALTYALTNAAAHTFFGNFTGSSGAPSYSTPTLASADFANQGTTATLLHGNVSGNPSWGSVVNADIAAATIDLTAKVTGILPVANGGTGTTATTSVNAVPFTYGANNTVTSTGVNSVVGTASQITVSGTTTVTVAFASSAALPGSPTTTTQSANDNSTKIATTAYVDAGMVAVGIQTITATNYTTSCTPTTSVTATAATVFFDVTAQTGALLFNAPTGTWANHQSLVITVKDNGTARALTYNSVYASGTVTAPTTTTISKTLTMLWQWNANTSKFNLLAYVDQLP